MDGKLVAVGMAIDQTQHEKRVQEMVDNKNHPYHSFATLYASLGLQGTPPGKAAYIARVSVLPGIWRKGVATSLMYGMGSYLLENGYEKVYFGTVVEGAV